MPTITLELTEEALVLLADRARRRGRPTGLYATQLMQQSLLLGDGDAINELFSMTSGFASLSSHLAMLLENPTGVAVGEHLEILRKQLEWLMAVTQSALSLHADRRRLQSLFESVPRLVQEFELRPVLQMVMAVCQNYKREAHRLECEVAQAVPTIIDADQNKLEQVLYNLIGNALKFSPEGGIISLQVSMSDSDTVLFTLTDQGMGMSPEVLAHLGQRSGQGGGVGFSLSKGFVELHGGRIWAESAGRGRGSVVSFTLPARPAIERDPEFNQILSELRRWRITLSALLGEVQTLPRSHYRFDSSARADFAQLVQSELAQLQALLERLSLGGDSL